MRCRRIVLPAVGTIERLCAEVHTRMQPHFDVIEYDDIHGRRPIDVDGLDELTASRDGSNPTCRSDAGSRIEE